MNDVLVWIGLAIGGWLGWQMYLQNKPKVNDKIACKFCGATGLVSVGVVQRKKGISGGKATGALLTGGVSMLLTGLSRKERARHLTCGNCGMEWDVA